MIEIFFFFSYTHKNLLWIPAVHATVTKGRMMLYKEVKLFFFLRTENGIGTICVHHMLLTVFALRPIQLGLYTAPGFFLAQDI